MKTIAAVLERLNSPLVIRDLELPLLKAGQVLVKIAFSGVCQSQLMEVRGKRGDDRYLPHLLGHEATGTVLETGPDVKKVKNGERVILGWIKGEGMDVSGSVYRYGDAIVNAGAVTTFSAYSVVSENRCVKLPEGLPMDVGVLFGCAIPTGAGMVINHVQPFEGSSLVVFGLGGIGMSALMATRLFKCAMVVAVDVDDGKLELAMGFGATHTINSSVTDPARAIYDLTKGKGVDFSVEATGLAQTIETAFRVVRKFGGLCVFASHPKKGDTISIDPYDLICGKRIEGSWGGESKPDRDVPMMAELYKKGLLPLKNLISHTYSLHQVNKALDDLENRRVIRALLDLCDA